MADPHERYIKKALGILEKLPPAGDSASAAHSDIEGELGEALLQRAALLADDHLETSEKLERLQKELAVFKEVNAETNRTLERKIEEISLLRLITDASSRAMLTQDPLKLILGKVIAIVGAETGSMMLHDNRTGRLEVHAASGPDRLEPGGTWLREIEKIADHVVASGKPYFGGKSDAQSRDGTHAETGRDIASIASFPLTIEGKTIGVLNLSSPCPNAFGEETRRIMHIIAGQIAVAVENVRLYGEVKKTKVYLESLVEKAGDAIFTLDRDHRIVSWNTGAERIFRREKKSVLGKTLYGMLPESLVSTLREKMGGIFDSGSILTIEVNVTRGDGRTTQIALTLSPIRGAEGEVEGVSGIAKDITERKRLEEELLRLNEAKANFVSTVSHELRTPLTSIKSMAEVLLHELTSLPEESISRYLSVINEECDRLSALISSLLDLQKLDAGKLEVEFELVPLAEVVRRATGLFEGVALQNRIELTTDFLASDQLTRVNGNRQQLMRILSNLLSNAIKYTRAGDIIRVRLSRESNGVKLTVSDSGIGIPDDQKEMVFEKFYQVDNSVTRHKGGTGLGLAITKELVALHGGRIWVESGQHSGCSFNVLIPAADAA